MHNVGCAWKHRITWWEKNGKIIFNLTKLQLSLSKSLLTQEYLYFFMVMPFYIINEHVCAKIGNGGGRDKIKKAKSALKCAFRVSYNDLVPFLNI
jgi:hypothetical protein